MKAEAISQGKIVNSKKKYFWLILPTLCDFSDSTLSYFALTIVSASINNMFKGVTPVFTAFFAICILKTKLYGYNWVALVLTLVGMVLVGLSSFLFLNSETTDAEIADLVTAYIMMVVSFLIAAVYYNVEEWIVSKYFIHPFEVVGVQGCWGFLFYIILLSILCNVQCNLGSTCVYNPNNGLFYFENLKSWGMAFVSYWNIPFTVILNIFMVAGYNFFGQSVTSYIDGITRAIANTVRTIVVWVIGIIITLITGN
jgi:uncharacterized membrane protein